MRKFKEALAPLREPAFRWQFLARTASSFGDNVAPVALAFAMLESTGSTADLGIVLAAQATPLVLLLLVGGVWADRLPRQRVMMVADVVRFGTQAGLATLFITGHPNLWIIVALQVLNGASTAFFQPASSALTASTVSPKNIQPANALLALQYNVSGIAGPLFAALLVTSVGAGWALAVDALTFAASGVFLLLLRLPKDGPRTEQSSFLSELAGGWRDVTSRQWVWVSIVGFMASQLLLSMFFVLGPAMALDRLGGPAQWAFIVTALSVGQIIGSLVALRVHPHRLLLVSKLVELLFLPLVVLIALHASLSALLVAAVIAGVALSFPDTLWYTALQQHIPKQSLSRVSSYDWLGSQVLRPVGYVAAAAAASAFGVGGGLLAGAVLLAMTMVGSLSLSSVRNLRRLDNVDSDQDLQTVPVMEDSK